MAHQKGFSLVELVIAIGLSVFVLAGGFYVMFSLFHSEGGLNLRSKAQRKLQTVETQLRFRAASEFDRMEETDFDRTGNFDQHIRILSTVGPIDANTRVRRVTLTAQYKVGPGPWDPATNVRSIQRTFDLTKVSASLAGGAVKVRVVRDDAPNIGIPDIDVSLEGLNFKLMGRTDSNGDCIIYGARLTSALFPTNPLQLDGSTIATYFPGPPSNAEGTGHFSLVKAVDDIREGVLRDAGTFRAILPGSLTGELVDFDNSDTKVEGAPVYIVPQEGLVPPCVNPRTQFQTNTDSQGIFTFTNVVPGQYYLFFRPTSQYVGLDVPNSSSSSLRSPTYTVVTNAVTNVGQKITIKKGSIRANIKRAFWNTPASSYAYDVASITPGTQVDLIPVNPNHSHCFHSGFSGNPLHSFSWIGSNSSGGFITVTTSHTLSNSGELAVDYLGPYAVNQLPATGGPGFEHDYNQQGDLRYIIPDHNGLSSSFAPILVKLDTTNTPPQHRFLIRSFEGDSLMAPYNAVPEDFRISMRTNHLQSSGNSGYTWGYLSRDNNTFANVRGSFTVIAAELFPVSGLLFHNAYTYWIPNSTCTLRGLGGVSLVGGVAKVQKTLLAPTTQSDQSTHWFNFKLSHGGNHVLIPNLPDSTGTYEKQRFGFYTRTADTNTNKSFDGTMTGYYKSAENTYAQWSSPLNISNIKFQLRYQNGPNFIIQSTVTTNISNGVIDFSEQVTYFDQWGGVTPYVTLLPGQDYDFGSVTVAKYQSAYRVYYLNVIPDINHPWRHNYQPGLPQGVPYQRVTSPEDHYVPVNSNVEVVMVGTRQITGTVRTPTGDGIANATITLEGDGMGTALTIAASNATGNVGAFDFETPQIDMAPGYNVRIRASAPGYQTSSWQEQYVWYQNPAWATDIILTPNSGGGGGGQSGGF